MINKEQILKVFTEYFNSSQITIDEQGFISCTKDIKLKKQCSKLPVNFLYVGGWFHCSNNQLQTLEGAPQEVGISFDCSNNQLKTLQGAPRKVGGDFDCSKNQLQTLEGAPKEVGETFYCTVNQLKTLQGAPRKVGGGFNCTKNQLQTLEGAPRKVKREFNCSKNQLKTLKDAPIIVGWHLECSLNPDLYDISAFKDQTKLVYDKEIVERNLLLKKFEDSNGTQGMTNQQIVALADVITDIFS